MYKKCLTEGAKKIPIISDNHLSFETISSVLTGGGGGGGGGGLVDSHLFSSGCQIVNCSKDTPFGTVLRQPFFVKI